MFLATRNNSLVYCELCGVLQCIILVQLAISDFQWCLRIVQKVETASTFFSNLQHFC